MLTGFQNIAKIPELKRRITMTLALLAVYRIGAHIPTPGINNEALAAFFKAAQGTLLGLFDMFSGGALSQLSVFALGIMPYISASIILQLLTVVIPHLERLSKEGEAGRRKITQYTRYGTVVLSLIQGFGIAFGLEGMTGPGGEMVVISPGWSFRIITVITLTAGTAFIMWLGEQITERGIGNGISLIIFAGIVAGIPNALIGTLQSAEARRNDTFRDLVSAGHDGSGGGLHHFHGTGAEADSRPVCQKSCREARLWRPEHPYPSEDQYVRGYSADLCILDHHVSGHRGQLHQRAVGANRVATSLAPGTGSTMFSMSASSSSFCFFYTAIVFNPVDVADNMKKYGGFIPGIRPGRPTAEYIDKVLSRITLGGAIYVSAGLCSAYRSHSESSTFPFYFGGTALLIVIGVAMDTLAQIEAHMLSRHYEGFLKKGRMVGRR